MYSWKAYSKRGSHKTYGVYAPNGRLLCVCVYKKGAIEVCESLNSLKGFIDSITSCRK